jgi:hypothetical protein
MAGEWVLLDVALLAEHQHVLVVGVGSRDVDGLAWHAAPLVELHALARSQASTVAEAPKL